MTVVGVVVHYGSNYDDTVRACRSITTQSTHPECLYVIDNGPEFGRVGDALISGGLSRRDFVVYSQHQNLGFAEGSNIGLRAGLERGSEFLLVCNSDAVLEPSGLESMIGTLRHDPSLACTGPIIRNVDGSPQSGLARLAPITGRPIPHRQGRLPKVTLASHFRETVYCLSGACLLFRREALETIGLFDPRYFCYWEESDWFERCADQRWRVALSPEALLVHSQGGSGSDDFELFHLLRNWRMFLKDHRSGPVRVLALLLVWGFVVRHVVLSIQGGRKHLAVVALRSCITRLPRSCNDAVVAAEWFAHQSGSSGG